MIESIIKEFCTKQREWLLEELQASNNNNDSNSNSNTSGSQNQQYQQQQRQQNVLHHLEIDTVTVGLYGRTVIQLCNKIASEKNSTTINSTTNNSLIETDKISNIDNNNANSKTTTSTSTTNNDSKQQQQQNQNQNQLSSHRFTTGDEVEIRKTSKGGDNNNNNSSVTGVINEVTDTHISVALYESRTLRTNNDNTSKKKSTSNQTKRSTSTTANNSNNNNNNINNDHDNNDDNDNDNILQTTTASLSLFARSNIEVHNKLISTLDILEKYGTNDHPICGNIIKAAFIDDGSIQQYNTTTSTNTNTNTDTLESNKSDIDKDTESNSKCLYNNNNLDYSQKDAIQFVLNNDNDNDSTKRSPISLIHGPPGTGKTTTLIELIYQAVYTKQWKVLVTAPSNVAVDTILSKLTSLSTSSSSTISGTTKPNKKNSNSNQQQNKPIKVVRLGHPARIQSDIIQYSLEALVQSADGTDIVTDVRNELQSYLHMMKNNNYSTNKKQQHATATATSKKNGTGKTFNKKGDDDKIPLNNRRLVYQEIKNLRKEIRTREERIVSDLIDNANVVLATCVGSASSVLKKYHKQQQQQKSNSNTKSGFDLIIIDEAGQSLEVACWIPILLQSHTNTKIVLAGDHLQLSPTILSNNKHVQIGLQVTLFERILQLYNDTYTTTTNNNTNNNCNPGRVSRMLKVQYRMNELISNWASQASYNNQLLSHSTVKSRTLSDIVPVPTTTTANVNNNENENDVFDTETILTKPFILIDTTGCSMYESTNDDTGSRYNIGEVLIVQKHVEQLLQLGVQPNQIAIISPYNGQVEKLKLALLNNTTITTNNTNDSNNILQIRSVDGFQGGEREVVIISLVRSSDNSNTNSIGFLHDNRRLNVAITRAKRHCCVICDTETVSQSLFIKNLILYIENYGEVRSAIEYTFDSNSTSGSFNHNSIDNAASTWAATKNKIKLRTNNVESTSSKNSKSQPSSGLLSEEEIEKRRCDLLDKIQKFQQLNSTKPGATLIFNKELNKLERKLVHEIAEQLQLDHKSDGIEGINRTITISIPLTIQPPPQQQEQLQQHMLPNVSLHQNQQAGSTLQANDTKDTNDTSNQNTKMGATVDVEEFKEDDNVSSSTHVLPSIISSRDDVKESGFVTLQEDSDDDDDGDDDNDSDANTQQNKSHQNITLKVDEIVAVSKTDEIDANRLLADLAQERQQRQKQQQQQLQQKQQQQSSNSKKMTGKQGKKLGGSKLKNPGQQQQSKQQETNNDTSTDKDIIDDDIAFLDAQIDKKLNSHGRTVDATGKVYRTIINGMLVEKPKKSDKPFKSTTSVAAAAALRKKIESAQEGRQSTIKKKKK